MVTKLQHNLKIVSIALFLIFLFQLTVAVPVSADAFDAAQSAVAAAEASNSQADINTAQVMVSDLPAGEDLPRHETANSKCRFYRGLRAFFEQEKSICPPFAHKKFLPTKLL